jgi:hypothetical protein
MRVMNLTVLTFALMAISSCGLFEDPLCKNGARGRPLQEYQGELNFNYQELFDVVKECVSRFEGREINRTNPPTLKCVEAVSCSELTNNNCITTGVAGRYCVANRSVLIPCYYNELQENNTAAIRLIRHEVIHDLGFETDFQHESPIWAACDNWETIEGLIEP